MARGCDWCCLDEDLFYSTTQSMDTNPKDHFKPEYCSEKEQRFYEREMSMHKLLHNTAVLETMRLSWVDRHIMTSF
jgi:hypothetical protein